MKTKIFALALAASMAAGSAFAQTATQQTQSGGSNATALQNERGVPMLPDETIGNFYTDSTRTTMKPDADLNTWWQGLTVQEREAAKQGCAEDAIAAQQRDLPESTLNVCRKVNTMM